MTKKKLSLIVSILFLVIYYLSSFVSDSAILGVRTISPSITNDSQTDEYSVVKVVDGDTLKVSNAEETYTIRLIGVDTPETVDPRKKVQCFGKEASTFLKNTVEGKAVILVPDSSQQNKDKYARLLRYVYLRDGTFVNRLMIAEGYGYEYTYDEPYTFQKEFKELESMSQREGKGLWSVTTCRGER